MPEHALTVRSQRVLDLAVAPAEGSGWNCGFHFHQFDEDTGDPTTRLVLTDQSWEDLGRPMQITITIEPGDLLNDG